MRILLLAAWGAMGLAGQAADEAHTKELAKTYAYQLNGITGLRTNGFPIVDASKANGPEARALQEKLLASNDAALLAATAEAMLHREAAIGASLGRRGDANQALADRLLRRAEQIEPKNAKWHTVGAQLYAERAELAKGGLRVETAKESLAEFEAAIAIDPNSVSDLWPSRYARMALEAGELVKAKASAERCLTQASRMFGQIQAIHDCTMTLGRVALREGDEAKAGEYLLAAGRVEPTPTLETFGPNMMLAQELLAKGRKDLVLAYFELCGKFWIMDRQGLLSKWTAEVKAGESPNFGANLIY